VGVAYSDKFRGVFESVEMGDMVLDARELEAEELLRFCLERFEARDSARELLSDRIAEVKERIWHTFNGFFPDGFAMKRPTGRSAT
jgi:polysaccharide pyruvyl transferase WcaK-like protein